LRTTALECHCGLRCIHYQKFYYSIHLSQTLLIKTNFCFTQINEKCVFVSLIKIFQFIYFISENDNLDYNHLDYHRVTIYTKLLLGGSEKCYSRVTYFLNGPLPQIALNNISVPSQVQVDLVIC